MDAELPAGAVVVVIDVIRAFTTAAVAFERGATGIVCAPSVAAGRGLRRVYPDHLLVGEHRGLKPTDFDFGNSPFEMSRARIGGRGLIQATSNGTRGLVRPQDAAALLASAAVNVSATVRWIRQNHPHTPCAIVCTGRTTEDWACARHLRALLLDTEPTPTETDLIAGIEQGATEHAEAYATRPAIERVDLARDLPFCHHVDRSAFAMVAIPFDDHVRLEGVPC